MFFFSFTVCTPHRMPGTILKHIGDEYGAAEQCQYLIDSEDISMTSDRHF